MYIYYTAALQVCDMQHRKKRKEQGGDKAVAKRK